MASFGTGDAMLVDGMRKGFGWVGALCDGWISQFSRATGKSIADGDEKSKMNGTMQLSPVESMLHPITATEQRDLEYTVLLLHTSIH